MLVALVVLAFAQLAAAILTARGVHLAVDDGLAPAWLISAIAGLAFIALLLEAAQRWLCQAVGQAYVNEVRDELFAHLLSIDSEVFHKRRHGAMLQAFVGDLTALRQWVSEGLVRGSVALFGLLGLTVWTIVQVPTSAIFIAGLVLAAIAAGALLLRPLDRAVRDVRRARGRVAGFASERLAAISTIQASGRLPSERRRLTRRVKSLNSAMLRRAWLTGLLHGLAPFAATLMILALISRASDHSTGSLAGQIVLIGLLGILLRDLARSGQLLIPGRVSVERLTAMFKLPAIRFNVRRHPKRANSTQLAFQDLVLVSGGRQINAVACPGQVLLLEGDGAMRRALFRVLTGQAKPTQGSIVLGTTCLSDLAISQRRKLVGYYSPDLPLLKASHSYNLRYRAPHTSREESRTLAARLEIDLEAKEQSAVRIKLARAILGSPPILLLELADPSLGSRDFELLADEISNYPGVVIFSSDHPMIRNLATKRWELGEDGLNECVKDHVEGSRVVTLQRQRSGDR